MLHIEIRKHYVWSDHDEKNDILVRECVNWLLVIEDFNDNVNLNQTSYDNLNANLNCYIIDNGQLTIDN